MKKTPKKRPVSKKKPYVLGQLKLSERTPEGKASTRNHFWAY